MSLVKLVGAHEVLLVEQQRVVAAEQPRSPQISVPVAHQRTERRRHAAQDAEHPDIESAELLKRQETSGKQQAIARQEEPDQQAALGEDDRGDRDEPAGEDDRLRVEEGHTRIIR